MSSPVDEPPLSPPTLPHQQHDGLSGLPSALLSSALVNLPPKDVARILALTSKRITQEVIPPLDAQGMFFSSILKYDLDQFVPAKILMELEPTSFLRESRPLRIQFREAYEMCTLRLNTALDQARLRGIKWAAEFQQHHRNRLIKSWSILPEGHQFTSKSLKVVTNAFRCDECHSGHSTKQCMACGELLCSDCSITCGQETNHPRPTLCPFALCRDCHEANFVGHPFHEMQLSRMDTPGLIAPICDACPTNKWRCPLHVETCIFYCSRASCEARRCPRDFFFTGKSIFGLCEKCSMSSCGSSKCRKESGVSVRHCMGDEHGPSDCFTQLCTKCHSSPCCPKCYGYMCEI